MRSTDARVLYPALFHELCARQCCVHCARIIINVAGNIILTTANGQRAFRYNRRRRTRLVRAARCNAYTEIKILPRYVHVPILYTNISILYRSIIVYCIYWHLTPDKGQYNMYIIRVRKTYAQIVETLFIVQ